MELNSQMVFGNLHAESGVASRSALLCAAVGMWLNLASTEMEIKNTTQNCATALDIALKFKQCLTLSQKD
jgi:hypothetical protein